MPAAPARSQQASAARAMAGSHPGWVRADRGRARSLPTGAGPEQATGRACRDIERHGRPAGSQPLDHRGRAGAGGGPVTHLAVAVEAPALGDLVVVQAAGRLPHVEADRSAVGEEGATAHHDRGVTLAADRAVAELAVAVETPAVDLGGV